MKPTQVFRSNQWKILSTSFVGIISVGMLGAAYYAGGLPGLPVDDTPFISEPEALQLTEHLDSVYARPQSDKLHIWNPAAKHIFIYGSEAGTSSTAIGKIDGNLFRWKTYGEFEFGGHTDFSPKLLALSLVNPATSSSAFITVIQVDSNGNRSVLGSREVSGRVVECFTVVSNWTGLHKFIIDYETVKPEMACPPLELHALILSE